MGRDTLEYANKPNDLELEVLRILNREDVPGRYWGPVMSVCCENLKNMGFAKGHYEITEKGKEYLKSS